MFGNAQQLNLAKQWLRALPADAMPHGHQHPTVGPPPRGLRGEAMGHCAQKALLGARDTNPLLRAGKCIMFGIAQPLNQVKQWLRALPDAMPHGLQHPISGGARASLRGENGQFFYFAPRMV